MLQEANKEASLIVHNGSSMEETPNLDETLSSIEGTTPDQVSVKQIVYAMLQCTKVKSKHMLCACILGRTYIT